MIGRIRELLPGIDTLGNDAWHYAITGQKYRSTEPTPKIAVDNQNVTPTYVTWQTNGAGCPECQAAEAEGVQPLGYTFATGVQAPPAHPHCACSLQDASDAQDYYEYIQGSMRGYRSGIFELSSRF